MFPPYVQSYEGQAAIWLENIQDKTETGSYPCPVREEGGLLILDSLELVSAVYEDLLAHIPIPCIARRFHLGLIEGLASWARQGAGKANLNVVGLSGGVMNNATLIDLLPVHLQRYGLIPLLHKQLPPGDGGISFGQSVWGLLHQGS